MALGFIRKIFSFGDKKVEEVPAPAEQEVAPQEAPAEQPLPQAEAPVSGPVPDFLLRRDDVPAPIASSDAVIEEPSGTAETAPSGPSDHPPFEMGETAPQSEAPPADEAPETPPITSPVREESIDEADQDGAAGSPDPAEQPLAPVDGEGVRDADASAGSDADTGEDSPLRLDRDEPGPGTSHVEGEESRPQPSVPGRVTVGKAVEPRAEAPVPTPEPAPRASWVQRLRQGLSRSSRELGDSIAGVFVRRKLDEDTLQDLEDVLIRADLGVETAMRITDSLSSGRYGKDVSDAEVRAIMAQEVEKVLSPVALPLELDLSHKPHVILVVGVNGTGKTTTIGKLAAKLAAGGLSVMLAAGDTFRAAAIEQLRIWGERTGSPVVSSKLGADAAGLAWDAFEKAREAGSDVLIIDTAGRLQNKAELMAELEKIVRVLGRHDPEAPHTVLQTVDATTGQNALNQVEIFRNVAGVNGLVMTKLDGTARGGILVAIAARHRLPVYFIGVGEQVDDLEPFSAGDFARAIAGVS